jgi:alkanesulfonate monooxygenase SsuD/methylene tetrahydromethanopterin reductase-like flavin-dependent oxidoreductase (luciferase family)
MKLGIFSVVDAYPDEDARPVQQLYSELLEQAELADKLGFDSFWIAEHHFHPYGVVPRAAIWLAAAAQRTRRIRLGAAVVVLPFDNPLRTAEDYAMVDVLSSGRLNIGVGSGYLQHEFAGFNLDSAEKRQRFDEALGIITQAWSGARVEHNGRFYKARDVQLNVLPVQKPMPPLAVAILNNDAARFVGAYGANLMLIPYATVERGADLASIVQAYDAGRRESSDVVVRAGSGDVYFALHAYCGETIEQAQQESRAYFERYARTRLYARQRPFETLHQNELLAIGDSMYISRLMRQYDAMGLTHFLAITNFGGMPHAAVCASMSRLAACLLSPV